VKSTLGERAILRYCEWKGLRIPCSAIFKTFPTGELLDVIGLYWLSPGWHYPPKNKNFILKYLVIFHVNWAKTAQYGKVEPDMWEVSDMCFKLRTSFDPPSKCQKQYSFGSF